MRRKLLSEMSLSNRSVGDSKVVRRSTALSAFCLPTSCPNPTRLLASSFLLLNLMFR